MLQYEELRLRLINHEKTLDDLSEALGLDKMKEEIAQLEKEQTVDGFWDDIANSQKVVQRTSNLKSKVAAYEKLRQDYDDALVMIELSNEEEDEGMLDECTESVEKFESDLDTMTLTTLLSGEYDAKNAILTFHAGAGEPRRRIGHRCFSECIADGASVTALRLLRLIFLTATRQGSNRQVSS